MTWTRPARECHCRIDEPPAGRAGKLTGADRTVITNVAKHGWHLVQIPDEPQTSGWVFSVGMWHTLGSPELAVFGMAPNHAGHLINRIGDRIRSGTAIGPDVVLDDLLEDDRPVTFRPADGSWYEPMFGYATWFAQRPPLPIAQVVWSDAHGRFPWDGNVDEGYRDAQPSIWLAADRHPQGRWSGALIQVPWPFSDPPDTSVFTTRRIAFERHPVLAVVHNTDGAWQFLDGLAVTADDVSVVHMAHVVGAHDGTLELADLPRGWEAVRDSEPGRWTRRALADER